MILRRCGDADLIPLNPEIERTCKLNRAEKRAMAEGGQRELGNEASHDAPMAEQHNIRVNPVMGGVTIAQRALQPARLNMKESNMIIPQCLVIISLIRVFNCLVIAIFLASIPSSIYPPPVASVKCSETIV